ncbi:MAG: hypothetical protein ABIQ18_42075 [Umezawaea sp.]
MDTGRTTARRTRPTRADTRPGNVRELASDKGETVTTLHEREGNGRV